MKKLLLILAVGSFSLQVVANENINLKACTVHYTRVYVDGNGNYQGQVSFNTTAATCDQAVANARMAMDQLENQ